MILTLLLLNMVLASFRENATMLDLNRPTMK